MECRSDLNRLMMSWLASGDYIVSALPIKINQTVLTKANTKQGVLHTSITPDVLTQRHAEAWT